MARRVFITVAEASGDQHAAHLIAALRAIEPDLVIEGLGGEEMRAAGATIHRETVLRAAMGWKGALRYFELRRAVKWTQRYFRKSPPDLQICIDSWSMNWHFAQIAHDMHIPVLYYVAPQVWASRPGRVKKLARYVDRVACILPFEEKYFQDNGVNATFVGHPLFDALPARRDVDDASRFPNRSPVIGIAPGSRSSVARDNFPNLLEVADHVLAAFPQTIFRIPTMTSTHDVVEQHLKQWQARRSAHTPSLARTATVPPAETSAQIPAGEGLQSIGPFTFGMERFDELIQPCDLCLAVSGTNNLHIAGLGVPVIVVYRINPIVWNLAGRWIVNTRTFSLVNLLNDNHQQIVPEFVPWYGSNAPVAAKTLEYLRNPQLLTDQRDRMRNLIRTLNKPGASRNAANLALEIMNGRKLEVGS
jgi:lipid-A-disaccharide synthase